MPSPHTLARGVELERDSDRWLAVYAGRVVGLVRELAPQMYWWAHVEGDGGVVGSLSAAKERVRYG